jgi:hypothetical protein
MDVDVTESLAENAVPACIDVAITKTVKSRKRVAIVISLQMCENVSAA